MSAGQPALMVGIGLLLIGLVFLLLIWGLLRLIPRLRPAAAFVSPSTTPVDVQSHNHAILVVQSGGRMDYLNQTARQWFELREGEQPNLEILLRRIRPSEDFLKLCLSEGRGRFAVNGRPMEGTSYALPGPSPAMMVTLRHPEGGGLSDGSVQEVSSPILQILTDFNQAVAIHLDLAGTLRAILENVERLVPADIPEIKLWNANESALVSYRFGSGSETERRIETGLPASPVGWTQQLVEKREPIYIPDTKDESALPAMFSGEQSAIHAYAGVPLIAGERLIGTLEIGLEAAGVFSREDFEILRLVAGQAAIAVRNAVLFEEEQKRTAELGGLANLAQAIGSTRDSKDLFARLVQSIAPLIDVDILGFLIYDEDRRALSAQAPFVGMPAQITVLYQVPVDSGSPAEEIFLSQQVLVTENAMEDPRWQDMGFHDFAQAASLRDTALIPLVSAGRSLGYLHVSNHRNGPASFSGDELRLLNILANQIAPIIDNLTLVHQSRQRAQRSEALRRIVSLVNSSATLDEILRYAIQELARLLQADAAAVFLLDEAQGVVSLHKESLWGVSQDATEPFSRFFVDDPRFHFTVTGSQRSFISGRLAQDQRVVAIYRPMVEALKVESAIFVPLVVRERGIGELIIGSKHTDFFNNYDLQMMATAAGQLATAVEGSSLIAQTDEGLRRRVDQLTALTRIGREINTAGEMNYILQVIYDEGLHTTGAECGTILLFENSESGDAFPGVMLYVGDAPGDGLLPIEREVFERKEAIVVADFNQSEYQPPHDGVASALVVPIAYREKMSGIIHFHASTPARFDGTTVEMMQTLATQAAIALGNNLRYQEQIQRNELLRRRSDAISKLLETAHALGADKPLEQSMEALAYGIQQATPFQTVLISIIEPETDVLRCLAGAGIPVETMAVLKTRQQPLSNVAQMFRPEFKAGGGYFIPYNQRPIVSGDVRKANLNPEQMVQSPDAWRPEDALFFPLQDMEENYIGLISLDAPRDGKRPDQAALEIIEVFAAQAALILLSGRRLVGYKDQVETLTTSLQRQQHLLSISQTHLPVLLHKDLEQMVSIRNLDRRARRIRAGLEITETINRQLDAQSALSALGREMLTRLEMSISIVAENTPEGPRLLHVLGNIPRGTSPEALFGQRNPLRYSLQTGENLLVMNLEEDETWRDTPLLSNLHAKGFICLPILIEEKPVAGILAISLEPMPPLTDEDRQVYFQISRQVSIILQNISLLSETRRRLREVNLLLDFSRQLSGLDPGSIVEALLDSALRVVTAAHAGTVLLWEDARALLVPKATANYADTDSVMAIVYNSGEALPGQVFAARQPRRVDEVNFARDYNLPAEHLLHYREATGGRLPVSSMLLPIQTAEHVLGVLVLDNFNTAAAFSAEDETLLLSLTQQVALSLENVRLVQASQERAHQLQALTNVSATMSTSLQSGELVEGLLDQLGAVLRYDTAILWLRSGDQISVAAARGYADNEERIGLTVAVEDSVLLNEMIRTGQGIVVGNVRADARFPALVEAERLSWMGIPMVSKGQVIGVIALEKTEANYYTFEASQLVSTFASQAAVSIENAHLYEDSLRRAAELDERSQRLGLLNRLSSELSGSLNEDQILRLTGSELLAALSAERVSAVAFGRKGEPFLRVVLPEKEQTQPKVLPDAPLFIRLRESLGVFSTYDVATETDLKPLSDFLKGTQSLLVLPLVSGANLRALLFVHMKKAYRFSAAEIELARTICNQAAIALENARLYQSTVSTAERLATINQVSYEMSTSLDPEEIYAAIHRATAQLMPAESFVISLLDEERGEIEGVYLMDPSGRASNVRMPIGEGISGRVITSGQPLLVPDVEEVERLGGRTFGEGQPRSMVAVPITMAGKTIGMLSAQSYQTNAYNENDQQVLSTLANQAAVAIQNGRLYAETRRLADELEQRVIERTTELAREQRNTETLLRILTEVSSSLDLDRALNRTLALLNDAIGAEQGSILMFHPEDNTIHYRAGYGYVTPVMTESSKPTPLKAGEGLAGWVIKNRKSVLIDDVRKDDRWVKLPMSSPHYHSAIAAPLIVGEEVIGVIMVFHRKIGYFTMEHMGLVQAIGTQVAVSINNAQLYQLIRDQAERLGSMLRSQQVEASRQQAILEAVADGVLVTDPGNQITFINSSAERILALSSDQVVGHSLENFVGFFGKAASTWMQTIHSWSEDTSNHQPGDTYAEQLTIENKRVVLVHLAPVIWRNEFLGTVSIFRDITHEVEVDRLKSEFVATVSHELRTPMTSIKGYVDVLLMGAAGALSENQMHFLDIVRSNTDRLSVLVNDLLDISRIEAGRVSLSLQPLDLGEIVEEAIADILRRSQEENKPMAISLNAQPDPPRVIGDIERVRQILDNLVDNSYRYTPENGRITIRIRYEGEEEVQVDVQDNGIGIPLADQDHIFERFFRGEDPLVLATPGTGLGLPIVKQLVEMHKGRIWMKSKGIPGKGSTFSFTLPVYQAEE